MKASLNVGGSRRLFTFLPATCILAMATPGGVSAAGGDDGLLLEEIVVTATKRTERLLDVPVAVSAISAQDITTRGLTQYADYLNSVPGVYFEEGGPGKGQIRIRGLAADEGDGSAMVATYFGETITSVSTAQGGKPNLRLVDIERVEVLRGPQGTLFGANALTGVVRIVPKAPDLREFELNVGTRGFTTAHSSDASYHVEGVINIPVAADRLALRLVGYKDDIAGYIDNVVPGRGAVDWTEEGEAVVEALSGAPEGSVEIPDGSLIIPAVPAFTRRDINSEDTWGVRAALLWQASDRLQVSLNYAKQEAALQSEPFVQRWAGDYAQQRELDLFQQSEYVEDLEIANLVVTYDWDAVSLTSATSRAEMQRISREDLVGFASVIGFPPLPWELFNSTQGTMTTQEVRLQSRGDGPLQWIGGLFYLEQKVDGTQIAPDYSCPTCLSMLLFEQDFVFRDVPGEDLRNLNQKQRSVFGEVSYRFSPRWTLGAGVRYLEEELEAMLPASEGLLVGGVQEGLPPTGGTTYELNPSAYLRFKVSDDMTLYAQAARGFRSGQANQIFAYTGDCAAEAQAAGLGPLSDPDTLWSYELGIKSRLAAGRVGLNAAIFKQRWKDVQLGSNFNCGFNGTLNAGDVGGEGVEVELTAQLAAAWQINVSAAYNQNEFTSVSLSNDFEVGERVPGTSEKNASAGLEYGFDVNEQWSGFARSDLVYVGNTRYKFGQADSARIVMQDAYHTGNVRVGLQRNALAIDLFCRNVADRRSVVNTDDPDLSGRNFEYLLRPREIGVELRYSFR